MYTFLSLILHSYLLLLQMGLPTNITGMFNIIYQLLQYNTNIYLTYDIYSV